MRSHFDTFLDSVALTPASHGLTAIVEVLSDCSLDLVHIVPFIWIDSEHIFQ